MKRLYYLLLLMMPLLCSCSPQRTIDRVHSFFEITHFEGVPDTAIVKNETVQKKLPAIRRVTWTYGLSTRSDLFYEDAQGKTVRIYSETSLEENGYPRTHSLTHKINNQGMVVLDWFYYGLYLLAIILFLYIPVGWLMVSSLYIGD